MVGACHPAGPQGSYWEGSDTLSAFPVQWLWPGLVHTAGEAGLRGGRGSIPTLGARPRGGGMQGPRILVAPSTPLVSGVTLHVATLCVLS